MARTLSALDMGQEVLSICSDHMDRLSTAELFQRYSSGEVTVQAWVPQSSASF